MDLPTSIVKVIQTLEQHGCEAYVVGGAVRDALLGGMPADWDVTTSATPEKVQKWFAHTHATGVRYGTVTVRMDGMSIEVTTYRTDGEYDGHRRPKQVHFSGQLKDDLKRRDFTINALAYHPKKGLVDLFGGQEDLKNRVIRCIGDPDERFAEDALRMLRCIRFAAQLDGTIEQNTFCSVQKNAHLLSRISGERIQSELTKFLMAGKQLGLLHSSGIEAIILPELAACFDSEQNGACTASRRLELVAQTPPNPTLRYAALLQGIGNKHEMSTPNEQQASVQLARDILTRLRFDNQTKRDVLTLISFWIHPIELTEQAVRRAMAELGPSLFSQWLQLKRADTHMQPPALRQRQQADLDIISKLYETILLQRPALSRNDLAIDGNDLIAIGFCGKQIGTVFDMLVDKVLENPTLNERSTLLRLAKEQEIAQNFTNENNCIPPFPNI